MTEERKQRNQELNKKLREAEQVPSKEELRAKLHALIDDGAAWDFIDELDVLYARIAELKSELSYLNYDYITDGFMT